jgi:hypothetical protein
MDQFYWPDGVPRTYEMASYIKAFETVGFDLCQDGILEPGFEKIAIYAVRGFPTHTARQLRNGNWTTKFGDFEDVEHLNLDCLNGPLYGAPTKYMRRPR